MYRKVNAVEEIQHTKKDDFWGQAQVSLPVCSQCCVCSLNKCPMHCNIYKGFSLCAGNQPFKIGELFVIT